MGHTLACSMGGWVTHLHVAWGGVGHTLACSMGGNGNTVWSEACLLINDEIDDENPYLILVDLFRN